ncbi:YveK family protein [Metabacillus idriensis]|uniref:YveK family protein n=1 Tax=Metabacillus idriensis TaxID=324768 RepID=UPI003D2E513E
MKEETLDFGSFFQIIWKRFWIIILITSMAVLTSAYVSFHLLQPVYQAKVNFLISNHQDPKNPVLTSSIDDSLKLVTTYQDIVQSPLILKSAQSALAEEGHNITIKEKNISVNNKEESQMFELLVDYPEREEALLIGNAIADAFEERVQDLMNLKVNNVKVMNKATVNPDPVSPKPLMIMGITFVISFMVSIWIALLMNSIAKHPNARK